MKLKSTATQRRSRGSAEGFLLTSHGPGLHAPPRVHIQRASGPLSGNVALVGIETNVSNLAPHAATKCLHSLRIHFGTRLALFAASPPIACDDPRGRTRRASLLASGPPRRFAAAIT